MPFHSRQIAVALAGTTVLACAGLTPVLVFGQTPPTSATPAATPPTGAAAALAAAASAAPRPFRDVMKDAKEIPGFFTLYQKDEKLWIAIKPEQFGKLFFFSYNIPHSVGERGLYGSQMSGSRLVQFQKVGNQVQLIAKNTAYHAAPGTPQAHYVSQSYSDSLMTSAPAASQPHPDSKAILVDAAALLIVDIPGYSTALETAFRMPFALDARNSSFTRTHNGASATGIQVNVHFSVPKLSAPPLTPSPVPATPPPTATPDPRSLFVGFYYNFVELPAVPMRTRVADERIGHFVSARTDYTDDSKIKQKTYHVKRWRLEKSDPAAPMSEPKKPIVFWLDKGIPEKYRAAVTEGVLEWNKAFERIGFKNAVVVKQQTDKDDFDTMDARYSSIRWFTGADLGFAIGPSHMDPRTGEIISAHIATGDGFTRGGRRLASEEWGKAETAHPHAAHVSHPLDAHREGEGSAHLVCNDAAHSTHDHQFALEILDGRGVPFDSPEAEALAKANIRRNVMHEVGHTLGLRHNFRGSTIYSLKQLEDTDFTRKNGLAGSIMEYLAYNVAPTGAKQGDMVNTTIGPYDYWAIEYAYKEIDPANEAAELAKIASRSNEPLLAYATDEDAGSGAQRVGIDPAVNTFDLGSDPLEYYKRRMALNREVWTGAQNRKLGPNDSYESLTRSLMYGFNELARVAPLAAKYVGGITHLRDRAGSGRPLYEPVPMARQREALALITRDLFESSSFRFKPEFISRLAIDHFERSANPDTSIAPAVLNVQTTVLDVLLSDNVATRMVNAAEKVADSSKLLRLGDLYDTLQGAIWSELKSGTDIPLMRRNLQREHVKRITAALLRPSARAPADAISLQRENAAALATLIRTSMAKPMSREAKAHLSESFQALNEALKAPLQKTGV